MRNLAIITIISVFVNHKVISQDQIFKFSCGTNYVKQDKELTRSNKTNEEVNNEECYNNIIRLNINFFLREDGTGNFTEVDDGFGNSLNGYEVANTIVKEMNNQNLINTPLNTPPNNNIPSVDKDYFFVLNGVYFHRTNDIFFSPYDTGGDSHHVFGEENQSVINIYYSWDSGNVDGYASDIDVEANDIFTVMNNYNRYTSFLNALPGTDFIGWFYHSTTNTTAHEIGHLLGLSHVVSNIGANTDADGCQDTPTRQEIIDNFGVNPDCGWASGYGCSNNLMDYTGKFSLSPCQINIIHNGLNLDNGTKRFLACLQTDINQTFCSFSLPTISYFGNKVKINECTSGTTNEVKDETHVYFNDETVIYENFEVFDQTSTGSFEVFEIAHLCACD